MYSLFSPITKTAEFTASFLSQVGAHLSATPLSNATQPEAAESGSPSLSSGIQALIVIGSIVGFCLCCAGLQRGIAKCNERHERGVIKREFGNAASYYRI